MNLFLGLLLSGLFIFCLIGETAGIFRWLFSVILLLGVFAFGAIIFTAGILITPFCLIGIGINLVFFLCLLPLMLTENKEKKNGRR